MHKNLGRTAATLCAGLILIHPSGISAQTWSVEPSTHSNVQWTVSSTPSAMHAERLGASSHVNIRDWTQSERQTALRSSPQFRSPRLPAPQPRQHSRAYRDLQRVTAAFALGVVGAYVGFVAAYSCGCAGNSAFVGMGIGGGVGAVVGATLVR